MGDPVELGEHRAQGGLLALAEEAGPRDVLVDRDPAVLALVDVLADHPGTHQPHNVRVTKIRF